MNCDQAFDAITNPARTAATELDDHLIRCPRCRQLREVLAPALDLLCDESDAGDSATLPPTEPSLHDRYSDGRTSSASPDAVRLAEAAAERLAGRAYAAARPSADGARFPLTGVYARAAALVVFGAVAGYCIGPWPRDADVRGLQALPPAGQSREQCSRHELSRDRRVDARSVVASCVACHFKARDERATPATSSTSGHQGGAGPSVARFIAGAARSDASRLISCGESFALASRAFA